MSQCPGITLDMFQAYEAGSDDEVLKRLGWATVAALGTFLLLAGAISWWASRPIAVEAKEESVDVSFRPLPKVEAPPPVVPKVEARKPAPLAAPAAMVAPREIPVAPPPEAEAENAVAEKFTAVGGTGDGSAAGMAGALPINLPENGVPPRESPDNVTPEFPESARKMGAEGLVVLKVVVLADGGVGPIVVMKGEEPFVSAALSAVATWRYSPALVEGVATSVYRIVKIPFRLK